MSGRNDGWKDIQTMDIGEPVYVIEKLSFVRRRQSFGDLFNRYGVEERLFISV